MIWVDSETGDDAPSFSATLSYDLLAYSYALLGQGLLPIDMEVDRKIARVALESAAEAIEAVAVCGKATKSINFHHLLAWAAFHFGRATADCHRGVRLDRGHERSSTVSIRDLIGSHGWRELGLSLAP